MKNILCFGDSNTWGFNPVTGQRYDYDKRWTSVLQKELGEDFHIIPEGLNGRTTVWDDPIELHKNGAAQLPTCLESHKPLDLVIIMLGTNDLKQRFSLPAGDIAAGAGVLVDIVKKSSCGADPNGNSSPEVLLLIPPEVRKLTKFAEMFAGSREKSLGFSAAYTAVANEKQVPCLDIGRDVRLGDADGIHFEEDQLEKLGKLLARKVKELL